MSKDSNTVYIGRKPTMSYVLAVITNFNSSETKEVMIKARGRSIDLKVTDIAIGTEEIQQEEGGTRNVSTIEIKLERD
jgi:DNA-binding protein